MSVCFVSCSDQIDISGSPEQANISISSALIDNYRWHAEGKKYEIPCFTDNMQSKNCTYDGLLVFLRKDKTDRMIFSADADVLNSCERYSLTLHDNAEKEGIRCGYAIITFSEIDEIYGRFGHALCAFDTVDRGMIYIDDTFSPTIDAVDVEKFTDCDKTGKVAVGENYTPKRLFDNTGYHSMGTVESVDIYWNELE